MCEEIEVDEVDVNIEFGFPTGESRFSISTSIGRCVPVSFDLVIPTGQGYWKANSTEFDSDHKPITLVHEVEIGLDEPTIGEGEEDFNGIICGTPLDNLGDDVQFGVDMRSTTLKERVEEEGEGEEED